MDADGENFQAASLTGALKPGRSSWDSGDPIPLSKGWNP